MSDGTFTAYKVSIDGNQNKRDFNHGLTKAEVDALPLGKQSDGVGEYVWQYGLNDGQRV